MNRVDIDNRIFYRRLCELALPIAFQSLMLASVAAGDALMLGRIAQDEMTAVSLATQIQFVQNVFLTAITAAGSILGAQYWGRGDRDTMGELFNMMLRCCGLLSLLFFTACEAVPGLLMHLFTHDEPLIEIGSAYLRIAGWSYLMTGASQCYLAAMKVTDHVAPSAWISSGAVVLNILLNAVFIFGLLGAPRMQARGAALATTLSRAAELLLCVGLSLREGYLRPLWRRFLRWPRGLTGDYLRQCMPLLGGSLLWGVGFTSYTAILGHMGADAAAANSVSAVVRDLAYGLKLKNLSFLIGFASTAIVLALTPLVLRMVILSETAHRYLSSMMVIMAVYMIGRCVNTVTINGVLDGGGDTLFDMYSLAVCMWGIAIPLAALGAFVFHWPPPAVYACTCLDEVGKIPWVMLRVRKFKWVQNLTRNPL